MKFGFDDTIAAIATAIGESGIGIVRISGKDALIVADKIFYSKEGKKPSESKTHNIHYGWVVRNVLNQRTQTNKPEQVIDEVLLTVMRAPRSYTRENVVEINCHGGNQSLRSVLDLVLQEGCRLALPGEFTKRAFLNGRIDLSQAEAVLDIIKAKTDSALKLGVRQLEGLLSKQINTLRKCLLDVLSQLEANIDFPEEEIGAADLKKILERLHKVNNDLVSIISDANQGRIYREGINAVICGRPNVGKSSLLNALLKQERSIVTPIAGTTRDTIEEVIDIRGIPVKIVDTAGILKPTDLIEKKAVGRTNKYIELADLIILMFDGSNKLTKQDDSLIRKVMSKKKAVIVVINKIDIVQRIDKVKISARFGSVIELSAKKMKNIDLLEDAIVSVVNKGKIIFSDSILVSNTRHIQSLKKCLRHVADSIAALDNKLSLEFISQDIKDALGYLDDILGKRFSEDLLDRIFNKFCIGK